MTTKIPLQTTPPLELIYEDGEPMDSAWQQSQMNLLIESTHERFGERPDYFTGGNIFLYYSVKQARAIREEEEAKKPRKSAFRGPDYFLVLGVDGRRDRDAWVVWEEEGRYPDLIVELLSPSTRREDLGRKKDLYEKTFRTLEYICYDPATEKILAWRLVEGEYRPIDPDPQGRIWSQVLGAWIALWEGPYQKRVSKWLRLFDEDGNLVPIPAERAVAERGRAEEESRKAEEERRKAEEERRKAEEERQRAEEEKTRADEAEAEIARLREQLRRLEEG